ncbi:MAG: ABC transporter ATP-binding protein [Dermatophilaceae bacterium]|nr:ABC transporter ATP-binding protein [Dermatophilaceae bacterium]
MQAPLAVRARGISKTFADVVALDAVDLDVTEGEVHGLVGPNGAGKTTLLGLLLGLAVADSGTLQILGSRVGRALAVPDGVAGFLDGPGLYPTLTARQNLSALTRLRGQGVAAREVTGALEQVGLGAVADDALRGFSLGMRQRLGLAAALLTRPRLLVLDEPANGLDPAGKNHVHGVIGALAESGTAVVMSSHRMDDLAALCTEVTLLATGRVVFTGTLSKLALESGEVDHKVVTTDRAAAARVAHGIRGLRVLDGEEPPRSRGQSELLVRGGLEAMDELVVRLVAAGLGVRELAPVVSPLESAFLALTGSSAGTSAPDDSEESR